MKPQDRRFWTATQVKVSSPEIINIKEADGFHLPEGSKAKAPTVLEEATITFRIGLEVWKQALNKFSSLDSGARVGVLTSFEE